MRARYTAHVLGDIGFIRDTLAPKARKDFNEKEVREWALESEWRGLEVIGAQGNEVEFVAKYKPKGEEKGFEHHEVATFVKDAKTGQWLFVDGDAHVHQEGEGHHDHHERQEPIVREGPKTGRNDPCTCGSGKKFKKCCGS